VSELHKFLFEGLPVRGMIVRLTDAWTDVLQRRASNSAIRFFGIPECLNSTSFFLKACLYAA